MEIPEKILEEIVRSILKEDAQNKLLDKINDLKSKTPSTGFFCDNPFNHIPATPEAALKKITDFQKFILYKTRLCHYYEVSERVARKKQKAAEKEAETHREENEHLKAENKRLKLQLQKLLGINKSRKSSTSSTSENSQREESSPIAKIPKKRGAPKGHRGNTRPIPGKIDQTVEVGVYHQCECGSRNIDELSDYDSKYIEEIEFRIVVTEKKYMRGQCLDCGCLVRHPDARKGPPVSIGNNTAAMLASMRQLMGSSYRKLSLFFTEYFNFPIEPSGVLGIVNRTSDSLEPIYSGLGELLRSQDYLNGDETGWKNDGKRWQLWCFCNSSMAYYHADPSRGGKVPEKILGKDYKGTVNCDFYGAYNFLGKTQRCLVHLQRDIHDETEVNSRDRSLRQLKQCIDEVVNAGKKIKTDELKGKNLKNNAKMIEQRLKEAGEIKAEPETRTAVLVKRINTHMKNLARFAYDPKIDFHNNRAEQMIRPAVIFRKISFGNRSDAGALRYSMLSTVLQTMLLQKKNVFSYMKKIIDTPPEQRYSLVKEFDSS